MRGDLDIADAVARLARFNRWRLHGADYRVLNVVGAIDVRNPGLELQPVGDADACAHDGLDQITVGLGGLDQADEDGIDDLEALEEEAVLGRMCVFEAGFEDQLAPACQDATLFGQDGHLRPLLLLGRRLADGLFLLFRLILRL